MHFCFEIHNSTSNVQVALVEKITEKQRIIWRKACQMTEDAIMEMIAGLAKIPASDLRIIERYFDAYYFDHPYPWIVKRIHQKGFSLNDHR